MYKLPLWAFLFALTSMLRAQSNAPFQFPESCIGEWTGTLGMYAGHQLKKEVELSIRLDPPDSSGFLNYVLVYFNEGDIERRPYLLKPQKTPGYWLVDEQNGILLQARVMHQTFTSVFQIKNQTLISEWTCQGDSSLWEILVFPDVWEPVGKSDSLEITATWPLTKQAAVLQRLR